MQLIAVERNVKALAVTHLARSDISRDTRDILDDRSVDVPIIVGILSLYVSADVTYDSHIVLAVVGKMLGVKRIGFGIYPSVATVTVRQVIDTRFVVGARDLAPYHLDILCGTVHKCLAYEGAR